MNMGFDGAGRPDETERITGSISRYLDLHEQGSPEHESLTNSDIARSVGVSKRHLSRTDGPYGAIRARLARLKGEGVGRAQPELPEGEKDLQGDLEPDVESPAVDVEIRRRRADTVFSVKQFLAYHETQSATVDSPLMLADLEKLIARLSRAASELRPLVAQVNRTRRGALPTGPDADGSAKL